MEQFELKYLLFKVAFCTMTRYDYIDKGEIKKWSFNLLMSKLVSERKVASCLI